MKLKHLHAPDGHLVGINPDQVVSVRAAEPGAYAPGARAVVVEASGFQAVTETPEQAEKELEAE